MIRFCLRLDETKRDTIPPAHHALSHFYQNVPAGAIVTRAAAASTTPVVQLPSAANTRPAASSMARPSTPSAAAISSIKARQVPFAAAAEANAPARPALDRTDE